MILLVVDTQKLIMTDQLYNFDKFKSNVNSLIELAREQEIEVAYVCHDDVADSLLTQGTIGFEVFDQFQPQAGEQVFVKEFNSAFKGTNLQQYLNQKQIKDIIICGLQTDLCIDATIKSGFELGYNMIIAKDCNTTIDNQHLTAQVAVSYYNDYIWNRRYGEVSSYNQIRTIITDYKTQLDIKREAEHKLKQHFLANLNQINTTNLGQNRIKNNLQLDDDIAVVEYCRDLIRNNNKIYKHGKNWYVESGGYLLTINATSFGIITAKPIDL